MFFSNGDFTCLGEFRMGVRCAKARGAESVPVWHWILGQPLRNAGFVVVSEHGK